MNLYTEALSLAQAHPIVQSWPGLHAGLERSKHKQPTSWQLPAIGCETFGGPPQDALTAIAAMTCSQISMLLVDDILDQDPRGEYLKIGEGPAANLAVGLATLAISLLLDDDGLPDSHAAARVMSGMMATVARGQELDIQNEASEAHYWEVTHAKSAVFFGTGLYLGAFYTSADPEAAAELLALGQIYGEVMQIHDDLNDCLANPANPDWLGGRYPLPILFAEVVDHPQRERFLELRPQVAESAALEEAQAILVSSGAISYCVNELMLRHENALSKLDRLQPPNPEPLQRLLNEVIAPVKHLFEKVGAPMRSFRA